MDSFASLRVRGEERGLNGQSSASTLHQSANRSVQISSSIAIATFVKLLKRVAGETSHQQNLAGYWQLQDVPMGEVIVDCLGNGGETDIVRRDKFAWLVCGGKVRILAHDWKTDREVSVQLLSPGEIFGIDDLLTNSPTPYRAIASTNAMVAKIPWQQLQEFAQQFPNLQQHLIAGCQLRQKLLFLKTQTSLFRFPSSQLQPLVDGMEVLEIPQGEKFANVATDSGRYWLVKGEIIGANREGIAPIPGESWDYPQQSDSTWQAQTNLLLYYLPAAGKEILDAVAPNLRDEIVSQNRQLILPTVNDATVWEEAQFIQTDSDSSSPSSEPVEVVNISEAMEFLRHTTTPGQVRRWWQSYPMITQQSSSDCGAACLAMVSQYWGKRISLNTLRNLAQTTRTGASLPAMAAAASHLGYRAFPIRVSLDILEWHGYPWIAHWRGIHYVVVWNFRGQSVTISDPAMGIRKISRDEFITNWTGYALALDPTPQLAAIKSDRRALNYLWQRFWPYRHLLLQLFLASILLQTLALATPLIAQIAIDRLFSSPVTNVLNFLALAFLGFGAWRIFMRGLRQYLVDYLSNHMDLSALSGFIRHTLRLPLQFFTSRQAADVITRIEENRKLQLFLTRQALVVGLDVIVTPICLVLMASYHLHLTLLVLVLILPIAILTLITSNSLRRVSQDISRESNRQNAATIEIVQGIATVKSAAAEKWVRWRWEERFANLIKARFRGQKLANRIQVIHSLINHIGNTAILWSGAVLVINNHLSVGQFVAFNMLISHVINPIFALLELRDRIPEVLAAIERLDDILTAPLEARSQQHLRELPPLRGEIRCHRLCFRYTHDQTRYVLQNAAFHLLPGQTIGIVGTPGSGKSTLVNLLAGLYKPSEGSIYIDGKDISQMVPQTLRSQMGVVSQDCFLFSGTVFENIRVFNRELDLAAVVQAAKIAGIHEFIENLPLGYQTQIGSGGQMLPTSTRQQIAIARALVRNPYILIFDEATTALNPEAEQQILQNIWQNTRVRIALIVTNRQRTLQYTDQIIVLDRGFMVENGTHQELISQKGLYANISQQYLHL